MVATTEIQSYNELKDLYCTTAQQMRTSFQNENLDKTYEYGKLLSVLPNCHLFLTRVENESK